MSGEPVEHDQELDIEEENELIRYIKLAPIWKRNPELWFYQTEARFRLAGITSDMIKFSNIVCCIDDHYISNVEDIVRDPPARDKYETIKRRILYSVAEARKSKLRCFLHEEKLGDEKPSRFLDRLRTLYCEICTESSLRALLISHLPSEVRNVVANFSEPDIDKLALVADVLMDRHRCASSDSMVNSSDPTRMELHNRLDALLEHVEALQLNHAAEI